MRRLREARRRFWRFTRARPGPAPAQLPFADGVVDEGVCYICGSSAGFHYTQQLHPRENWICLSCTSTSRDRMLLRVLGLCIGRLDPVCDWPQSDATLLETSGYRGNPDYRAPRFSYINLIYSGRADARCIYGDLSDLPIRTESLDFILTSDVFEHVRRDRPAWENVYRALKPGGKLVLQVPAVGEFAQTQTRVDVRNDGDVHLMPPEYHAEETLVYRYYGDDLLERLVEMGFAVLSLRLSFPEFRIAEQTTVVAEKGSYVRFGPAAISDRAWT